MLGRRTAEMHLALASYSENAAFAPEQISPEYLYDLRLSVDEQASRALETLERSFSQLQPQAAELARPVVDLQEEIFGPPLAFEDARKLGWCTRIHGDYHLGQVLVVDEDFVILDFEGEPARPLAQRRAKHSPLKDVAGMLRSFSYAAHASLMANAENSSSLSPWAEFWEQSVSAEFLQAYRQVVGDSPMLPSEGSSLQRLLDMYLLEKALYELRYELNNRPAWVAIPLMGILGLPQARTAEAARNLRRAG
jgi:maltose alpha-D-glucosyltransferase/alpha-amylase